MPYCPVFKSQEHSPSVLTLTPWTEEFSWLQAGFSTRYGGVSEAPFDSLNCGLHVGDKLDAVLHNREKLVRDQGFSLEQWVAGEQIHGSKLCRVTPEHRGQGSLSLASAIPKVDGLYTTAAGIFLASFYADCVPLFFLDPLQRIIGIAHAGWRGTVAQIGVRMVERWAEEFQSDISQLRVAIGPSIGGCCYEVDERIIEHFHQHTSNATQGIISKHNGLFDLDLKQINAEFLLQAGIQAKHIEVSRWCTSCHTDNFFSHRKEKGKTGRMIGFIVIKEEEMSD